MLGKWVEYDTEYEIEDLSDTSKVSQESEQIISLSNMDDLFILLPERCCENDIRVDISHIDNSKVPVNDVTNVVEEPF